MLTGTEAKVTLKKRGWSYRAAAQALGCNYVHLSFVLNGQRPSQRILAAVADLPVRFTPEAEALVKRKKNGTAIS